MISAHRTNTVEFQLDELAMISVWHNGKKIINTKAKEESLKQAESKPNHPYTYQPSGFDPKIALTANDAAVIAKMIAVGKNVSKKLKDQIKKESEKAKIYNDFYNEGGEGYTPHKF